MTLKRTRESVVTDDEQGTSGDVNSRPTKRRMTDVPATPLPTVKLSSAPRTPRSRTPYPSRPVDSPTNPVGRKWPQVMTYSLPPPSSFSQHLPLLFQLIRPNSSPRLGGVHRIVQVPLSYTFVQLRCLIVFLFGGGYGDPYKDRHLFELQKKLIMYAQTYRPGQIRSGYTATKLSTARDPCRYQPEVDEDFLLDDEVKQADLNLEDHDGDPEEEEEGEGEDQCWTWEPEEEHTLGHVWPNGGDLTRGIIYHHDETTAVHITISTATLPRRSGISNVPYVFNARGRVRLFPHSVPRLPKPVFSVPISKLKLPTLRDLSYPSPSRKASPRAVDMSSSPGSDCASSSLFGDSDSETVSEGDKEAEEDKEDPNATLDLDIFNESGAFATYLRSAYQHNRAYQSQAGDDSQTDEDDDGVAPYSTPGLVHTSSSPISSPLRTSSPGAFSSSPFISSLTSDDSYTPSPSSVLSALSTNKYTPAPQHAQWQRRRLERAQKRMEKHKKRAWMCTRDDDGEDDGEEVDELWDDKPVTKPAAKPKAHTWRKDLKKKYIERDPSKLPPLWVKPKLKPGEIWDPFGDEIEV